MLGSSSCFVPPVPSLIPALKGRRGRTSLSSSTMRKEDRQDLWNEIEKRGSPFILSNDQPKGNHSVRFDICPPTMNEGDFLSLMKAVASDVARSAKDCATGDAAFIIQSKDGFPMDSRPDKAVNDRPLMLNYMDKTSSFEIDVASCSEAGPRSVDLALSAIENRTLDLCLSKHLTEGGDDRIILNAFGWNKYYCPPYPLPASAIVRGSCTCSPPTEKGFASARKVLQDLWNGDVTIDQAFCDVRQRILKTLKLSVPCEAILHPSGSDAELIPLLVASIRARDLGCNKIVNLVAAAGEVGSGTACAAGGKHFSDLAPLGGPIQLEEAVEGFPVPVDVIEIRPRDDQGQLRVDYDDETMRIIGRELASEHKVLFIVHAVDGSKTGLRLPSRKLIQRLVDTLGDRVLIVLDACQMRSTKEELEWFLERGALILITASKFFSAPGFCGAVLIDERARDDLRSCDTTPKGLHHYLTQLEIPNTIPSLRSSLPLEPANLGLVLRWVCGLAEMEDYYAANLAFSLKSRQWVHSVKRSIGRRSPTLSVVSDDDIEQRSRDETRVAGCNSIVSFRIEVKDGSRYFNVKELRQVHRYMVSGNLGECLPSYAMADERALGNRVCYIGQPVGLGEFGALRIALSAPVSAQLELPGSFRVAQADDEILLDKVMLIAKYFDHLQSSI
mmetsp:Transcript_16461/g.33582  ORF Transcript_16461/g.33582 Transcript_16461/m.33582 type:complete len:673 (-) Transcript_16461:1473-3491(-)